LLIPAGPCRQSIKSGFAAADLSIVISAVDSSMLDLDGELYRSKPGFIAKMINIDKWDIAKNYFAFTGIGNPERFFATLQNHKLHIVDHMIFPDHHNYSQKDLDYLLAQSSKQKAILITTRKDYVKIDNKLPILCFDVELLIEKEEELIKLIDAKIF
jgi:tetraacyldisaccharide 4'-kinase